MDNNNNNAEEAEEAEEAETGSKSKAKHVKQRRGSYRKMAPLSEREQKKRESLLEDAAQVIIRKREMNGGGSGVRGRIPKGFMNKLLAELRKNECLADATRDTIHNFLKKKEARAQSTKPLPQQQQQQQRVQLPQQQQQPTFHTNMNMNMNPFMRMQMMYPYPPNACTAMMMPWNSSSFPFHLPTVYNNNTAAAAMMVPRNITSSVGAPSIDTAATAAAPPTPAAADDTSAKGGDKDNADAEEKEIRDQIFRLLDEDEERTTTSKNNQKESTSSIQPVAVGTNMTPEAHQAALAWASREWMQRKLDAKNNNKKLQVGELAQLVTTANVQFNLAPENHIKEEFVGTNNTPEAHEAALAWASREFMERKLEAKNNNSKKKLPDGEMARLIATANVQFNLAPENHIKVETVRSREKRQNPLGWRKFRKNKTIHFDDVSPKKRQKTSSGDIIVMNDDDDDDDDHHHHVHNNSNVINDDNHHHHHHNNNNNNDPDVSLAERFIGTFAPNRNSPMLLAGIRRRWMQLQPRRKDRLQQILQNMCLDEVGTTEEEVETIEALFEQFDEWSPTTIQQQVG